MREFLFVFSGFPGGSVVKNPPDNVGDAGLTPALGRSPEEGNGNPLQYSGLENPMDRGAWRAAVHGVPKRHDIVTEHAHTSTLQGLSSNLFYSCWYINHIKLQPWSILCLKSLSVFPMLSMSGSDSLDWHPGSFSYGLLSHTRKETWTFLFLSSYQIHLVIISYGFSLVLTSMIGPPCFYPFAPAFAHTLLILCTRVDSSLDFQSPALPLPPCSSHCTQKVQNDHHAPL